MALLDRLPVDSAAADLGHRLLMLRRAAQAGRSNDPLGPPLAQALRRAGLNRLGQAERGWCDRVEARRKWIGGLDAEALGDSSAPDTPRGSESAYLASSALAWSLPVIWGRLLHCLVRDLKPRRCAELGTGFGISTAFVAAALELNGDGGLISLDHEPRVAGIAAGGLAALGLEERVELVEGRIDAELAPALAAFGSIEWALIDAEHTEGAVLADFAALLPNLAAPALVIFDDIGLSAEMNRAWRRIAAHERVTLALDLHRLGIVSIGPPG